MGAEIDFQIKKKIEEEKESFATAEIYPNENLKKALIKEAFAMVLYERFSCFSKRIFAFK